MATPLGAVLPWYGGQFSDNSGNPLASGKVFFYEAGSSTKQDTYSDSDLATPNTNPVVLDSAGRATIFLGPNTYKVIVATSTADDPPVGAQIIRTIDGVAASTSLTNTNIPFTAGESIAAGQWIFLSNGAGSLTAGRWYLTDADDDYKSILPESIGISNDTLSAGEAGTALIGGRFELLSGTVTAGSTYYLSATSGAITSTAPTNKRLAAIADTTTSVILSYFQPSAFKTGILPGGVNYTAVGNVGSGEDDLMSITVASNLVTAGSVYRFSCYGITANNVNTKRIRAYFNGTAFLSTGAIALQDQAWSLIATIAIRSLGASGVTISATFIPGTPTVTENVLAVSSVSASASAPFVFKITGDSVSVPATDDIVQTMMISEKLQ